MKQTAYNFKDKDNFIMIRKVISKTGTVYWMRLGHEFEVYLCKMKL